MKKKDKENIATPTTSGSPGSKRGTKEVKTDDSSPNGSVSIPMPGTSTSGKRITTNSPVSSTSHQDYSIVDIVTDRVIDKLCRLDLTGESKPRSSSRADETQIQLVDYSFNAVVMVTLIARRPNPGRKYQFFKGTVYLSTNDIRLAEDVDKLLDSMKKGTGKRTKNTPVKQSEGESGASQEAEKGEEGAKSASPANNNEFRGASGQETSELESDSSHNSQHKDSENEKTDSCLNGIESPEDQVSESRGPVDDEIESSGDVNDEHQVLKSTGRKSGSSQRDPRGRRVGSMISCKTLESLESRMMDRVSKLRPVIESHGYDYDFARVIDQTEMARITYGVHEIAFQRLVVHSRAKTSRDLQHSLEKGTIQKMQPSH